MAKEGTIKVLGVIAIVYGILILALIIGVYSFAFASYTFQYLQEMGVLSYFPILVPMIIIAILYIVGGIALIKYKNWARILLIILSIVNLLAFPIGTIMGIIYLIYLFNSEVKAIMH